MALQIEKEETDMKQIVIILVFSLLTLLLSTIASADDSSSAVKPSPGAVIADLLVLRPIGFAGTIMGLAACIVSAPVTIPFNSTHEAAKVLVFEPYDYTFERPLGKM